MKHASTDRATFAAGCFWGVEEALRAMPGVLDVRVGYTGGTTPDPTYEQVCSGQTGHAEAVEIQFDPEQVPYRKLLESFWHLHDPTTPNRQGPDIGTQYRSAVFYHDDQQRAEAQTVKDEFDDSGQFSAPIVTEIEPAKPFYEAEDYHQQYFAKCRR